MPQGMRKYVTIFFDASKPETTRTIVRYFAALDEDTAMRLGQERDPEAVHILTMNYMQLHEVDQALGNSHINHMLKAQAEWDEEQKTPAEPDTG